MLTMYDAVTVNTIPSGAKAVAGYVNGIFQTFVTLQSMFPQAQTLSITVTASGTADCLDVETGDATVNQVAAWVKSSNVYRPVIYASVSSMGNVLSALSSAGISRASVRLWSAHYGQGNHICGPFSCGQIHVDMDGTQWTDTANGINLDESSLLDNFFATVQASTSTSWENNMTLPTITLNDTDTELAHWYIHRAQAILNAVYGNTLTIDGVYGAKTQDAVLSLQGAEKLSESGAIDAETWKVILLG